MRVLANCLKDSADKCKVQRESTLSRLHVICERKIIACTIIKSMTFIVLGFGQFTSGLVMCMRCK